MRLTSANSTHRTLLSRVDWRSEGLRAAQELRNREIHAPAVSTFRWWARRPHNVMGALLDAAVAQYGEDLTVADPFSGGGTVTFEAARRNLKAYAQDLYPWPARGLASALSACDPEELKEASSKVLAALQPLRDAYRCPDGTELAHVIRVRVSDCASCSRPVYEYPYRLVSLAKRSTANTDAYFGCRACGHLTLRKHTVGSFKCDGCGLRHSIADDATGCAHCGENVLQARGWRAVLVQELVPQGRQLKALLRQVRHDDPVASPAQTGAHPSLHRPIEPGKETNRLLSYGFRSWADLYTPRQLVALESGLHEVGRLACSQGVRDRLAFALLGAAEMPAFLSRWDRFYLKPFEGMANHRYTTTALVVECNLLSPVGRGTVPRRLESAAGALTWLVESRNTPPKVLTTRSGRRGRKKTDWDVLITTGSSIKQELRDESVNVIITDPPYYDDVQYGELSRLFHAWLAVYDPSITVDERAEAVPNSVRGTSGDDYRATIAACLRESRRTLKPGGRLVLTFHNKRLAAWRSLAGALSDAGFRVHALAAVLAENRTDLCKRNVNAMLHDLVIECVPAVPGVNERPKLEFTPQSIAEKNLAAIGIAMADCVRTGQPNDLESAYATELARLGAEELLID